MSSPLSSASSEKGNSSSVQLESFEPDFMSTTTTTTNNDNEGSNDSDDDSASVLSVHLEEGSSDGKNTNRVEEHLDTAAEGPEIPTFLSDIKKNILQEPISNSSSASPASPSNQSSTTKLLEKPLKYTAVNVSTTETRGAEIEVEATVYGATSNESSRDSPTPDKAMTYDTSSLAVDTAVSAALDEDAFLPSTESVEEDVDEDAFLPSTDESMLVDDDAFLPTRDDDDNTALDEQLAHLTPTGVEAADETFLDDAYLPQQDNENVMLSSYDPNNTVSPSEEPVPAVKAAEEPTTKEEQAAKFKNDVQKYYHPVDDTDDHTYDDTSMFVPSTPTTIKQFDDQVEVEIVNEIEADDDHSEQIDMDVSELNNNEAETAVEVSLEETQKKELVDAEATVKTNPGSSPDRSTAVVDLASPKTVQGDIKVAVEGDTLELFAPEQDTKSPAIADVSEGDIPRDTKQNSCTVVIDQSQECTEEQIEESTKERLSVKDLLGVFQESPVNSASKTTTSRLQVEKETKFTTENKPSKPNKSVKIISPTHDNKQNFIGYGKRGKGDDDEISSLKNSLGNLLKNQKKTIESLRKELAERDDTIEERDSMIVQLKSDLTSSKAQWQETQTSLTFAERTLISLKAENTTIKKDFKTSTEALKIELQEMKASLEAVKQEHEAKQNESALNIASLEALLEETNTSLEQTKAQLYIIDEHKETIKNLEKSLEEEKERKESMEQAKVESEEAKEKLQDTINCLQKDYQEIISISNKQIQDIIARDASIVELEHQMQNLEATAFEKEQAEQKMQQENLRLKAHIKEQEATLSSKDQSLKEMKQEIRDLVNSVQDADNLRDELQIEHKQSILELTEKIKSLSMDCESLKSVVSTKSFSSDKLMARKDAQKETIEFSVSPTDADSYDTAIENIAVPSQASRGSKQREPSMSADEVVYSVSSMSSNGNESLCAPKAGKTTSGVLVGDGEEIEAVLHNDQEDLMLASSDFSSKSSNSNSTEQPGADAKGIVSMTKELEKEGLELLATLGETNESGKDNEYESRISKLKAAFKIFQIEKEKVLKDAEAEKKTAIEEMKAQLEQEKRAFIEDYEQNFGQKLVSKASKALQSPIQSTARSTTARAKCKSPTRSAVKSKINAFEAANKSPLKTTVSLFLKKKSATATTSAFTNQARDDKTTAARIPLYLRNKKQPDASANQSTTAPTTNGKIPVLRASSRSASRPSSIRAPSPSASRPISIRSTSRGSSRLSSIPASSQSVRASKRTPSPSFLRAPTLHSSKALSGKTAPKKQTSQLSRSTSLRGSLSNDETSSKSAGSKIGRPVIATLSLEDSFSSQQRKHDRMTPINKTNAPSPRFLLADPQDKIPQEKSSESLDKKFEAVKDDVFQEERKASFPECLDLLNAEISDNSNCDLEDSMEATMLSNISPKDAREEQQSQRSDEGSTLREDNAKVEYPSDAFVLQPSRNKAKEEIEEIVVSPSKVEIVDGPTKSATSPIDSA